MSKRLFWYAAGAVLVVLLLAACGDTGGTEGAPGPQSGGSAGPAGTVHTEPSAASAPAPVAGCAAGDERMTIGSGQLPQPRCLRVGGTLIVDAPSSPAQPWQVFTTSDAQVLSCATSQRHDGAATATCHALRPGAATVATMTAPFAGDPHGPPQRQWRLAVLVRA
jgi:hypothetical protein